MKSYYLLTSVMLLLFSSLSFAQQIKQMTLEKKAPNSATHNSTQPNVHGPATPVTPTQKNKTNNVIVESMKIDGKVKRPK